ncbi:MAG: ABC-F family ATP-binding cassette domain-containing protein [Bauldia sp.]|nr:ABC-F family ATP-binding cassette domain-containing protein [Bauldia sp.]
MLQINDLTYRIGKRTLIERATMVLPDGAKAGLVGRNGTGKTTIFRLIVGDLAPEDGTITLSRGWRVGEVAQEAPSSEATLIETVVAADKERAALLAEAEHAEDPHRIAEIQLRLADIDAHSAEARAGAILSGLGFDAATQRGPCSALSGGWRMRVALAAVLFSEPDLLLLDEPTNYLDLEGTIWLISFLAKYRRSVLIISHDRDLLDRAVNSIVHLDQGKLVAYRGGYSEFERQRREKQALLLKAKKKQDEQRQHMQAFVDRFRAKATKARQAQSRLRALEKMEIVTALVDEEVSPFHFPDPAKPMAPPIIALDDAEVGYVPGRPVLRKLNLRVDTDDRIALLGSNGNGKSTLAKLLAGRMPATGGSMRRPGNLSVAYFAQHQLDELRPAWSAYDHVRQLMPGESEARVRARTGALGFPTGMMDTPAADLSGGEKARLLLGLTAFAGPHLLILDEPTNHLDIDRREALIEALNAFSGAIILISHDRHLIDAVVDRLWLVADGTVKPFDGDLDDYQRLVLDSRSESNGSAGKAEAKAAGKDRRREAAQRREEVAPLRKRIKEIEALMDKLQKEIQRLDLRLSDASLYERDASAAANLAKERAAAARGLATAEEDWLAASADYEQAMAE